MPKLIILAAFAVGASLGLTTVTGIDTLKPARIRAKARLREALAVDDKVSNPDAMTSVMDLRANARASYNSSLHTN